MHLREVKERIAMGIDYKQEVWSRKRGDGQIEVGINKPSGGSFAVPLPADPDRRRNFVRFMIEEFKKYT